MPSVVAIELNETNAYFLSGELTPAGTISLKYSRTIDLLPDFGETEIKEDEQDSTDESQDQSPTADNFEPQLQFNDLMGDDSEEESLSTRLAVTDTSHVLYKHYSLPFGDQKTISQVAPLQLQDVVPFDIEDFLFDNMVIDHSTDGSYNIVSSLILKEDVGRSLRRLKKIGAEPEMLTTKASALLGLANLFPDQLNNNYVIVAVSQAHCSIAIVVENKLKYLADIDILVQNHSLDIKTTATQLLCALHRVEHDNNIKFDTIFGAGPKDALEETFRTLQRDYITLNLESVVENEDILSQPLENLSWAIGLIASEGKRGDSTAAPLVDFRRGIYAYRPAFGNFIAALKSEIVYIAIAILMVIVYFSVRIYTEVGELNKINSAISDQFIQALGTPPPDSQNEVTYLQTRIADTTDQLREVGSLATLSPLNLIKELSVKIESSLEIEINRIDIGQEEVTFEGIVPNTPAVGKLDNVLNGMKNIFCEVEVSPLGQQPGKGVRVRSKLKLCS